MTDLAISPSDSTPKFFTVKDFAKRHAWATEGSLRHLIFYRESNGFDRVIRRIGRKILLDESAFFEWLDAQKDSGHAN